jgi:hypothetical protein
MVIRCSVSKTAVVILPSGFIARMRFPLASKATKADQIQIVEKKEK